MLFNLSCDVNFSHDVMHNHTGETGYDPAHKNDYSFKVLTHNINELTHQAELDQSGDETSIGHAGYAEPRTGVLSRIMNNPGIAKGMSTIIIYDVHRNRPREFLHRHKLHTVFPRHKEENWTLTPGGREARRILEDLKSLVLGGPSNAEDRCFLSILTSLGIITSRMIEFLTGAVRMDFQCCVRFREDESPRMCQLSLYTKEKWILMIENQKCRGC